MLLKIPITQSTMTSNKARYSATRRRAIQHGYRSGFEEATSKQITDAGLPLLFETDKIEFVWPSRNAKYTPDFKLPKPGGFYYVETKGFWGQFPIDPKRVYCTSNTPIWIYGMCFRTGIPRSTKEAQRHTRCLLKSRASHLLTKKYHKSG